MRTIYTICSRSYINYIIRVYIFHKKQTLLTNTLLYRCVSNVAWCHLKGRPVFVRDSVRIFFYKNLRKIEKKLINFKGNLKIVL